MSRVLKKIKNLWSDFISFFDLGRYLMNPKVRVSLFAISFLLACFTFVAFTSYLFTWKYDQDKVFRFIFSDFINPDDGIKNSLGALGAYISHYFFFNAIGISSFFIPFILFYTSFKFLLRKYKFPIKWLWPSLIFFLFWFSPFMSYVFSESEFSWGGAMGILINDWLLRFLGEVGTPIVFVLSLFIIICFVFDLDIINKIEKLLPEGKEDVYDDDGFEKIVDITNSTKDEGNTIINNEVSNEVIKEPKIELKTNEVIDNEESVSTELSVGIPEKVNTKKPIKSDAEDSEVSLKIETSQEDNIIEEKKDVSNNFDPTLDLSSYKYPTLKLLDDHGNEKITVNKEELEKNKNQIVETLNNYKITIDKIKATIGPTVTLYEIIPAPGTRISKIKNLEDDIALSLAALGIRIIAPMPGKGTIGIEVPNKNKEIVSMKTMLGSEKFVKANMELPLALGKTISNEVFIEDLTKMPHLLIAGATGQGKSVGINAILVSLLYKKHPSQLKFVLIDPKKVELSIYRKIEKHFLAKLPGEEESIITDTNKVICTLNSLCIEMDNRYELLKTAGSRNIKEYNTKFLKRNLNPNKGHKYMPYIVLVIDEFADLIMTAGREVETPIARLAQLARAIGIHLIIATQRPSVNIITGMIKANFPARIAFKVMSKIDSRTILDASGADQLIGRGDMLCSLGSDIIRLQCPFVDTPEVDRIVEVIGEQRGYPMAFELPEVKEEGSSRDIDMESRDILFEDAARIVVEMQSGSTSMLQRRLKLGYNRAGRLMDELEASGIVGPPSGSKPRDVLLSGELELERFLESQE